MRAALSLVASVCFVFACSKSASPVSVEAETPPPSPVLETREPPPTTTEEPAEPPASPEPTATASTEPPPVAFPASFATLDGFRILPKTELRYVTRKAALTPDSLTALDEVKHLLEEKPAITLVRIEVHTDSLGADESNLALSKARAIEVARALVKAGVPCNRLVAVGFGESKPIAPNDSAEGQAQNRRTEFIVAALRGKLIGGAPRDGGGVEAGDPCS